MNLSVDQDSTALSVLELNQRIKSLLESGIGVVWVRGEVSNFKAHTSGHYYLSIKDKESQIKAVMFRGHNSRLKFKPSDGLEVLVRGQISAYAPRGEYQIYIEHMEPLGAGALQKAFEQLKTKLAKEGLFDPAKKRPLVKRPKGIAIVTSPTGAAVQDILNVLKRRCPSIPLFVVPTLVQGAQAAPQIRAALSMAFQLTKIELIILARGGGSIEDMWCFNDEDLARLIATSPTPIISAVGHEIDFTISDFVADLRAPTPSAAAELAAQSDFDLRTEFSSRTQTLTLILSKQVRSLIEKTAHLRARLVDPKKRLRDLVLRQDELSDRLQVSFSNLLKAKSLHLDQRASFFNTFTLRFLPLNKAVESNQHRLKASMINCLKLKRTHFTSQIVLLDSLNPLQVLKRGFSFQTDTTGSLLHSVKAAKINSSMISVLKDGKITSTVTHIEFNPTQEG